MAVTFDEQSIKSAQDELNEIKSLAQLAEQDAQKESQQELTIDQEYELWRKNCHYMYDFVYESSLKWPSLSVQWFPDAQDSADGKDVETNLLLGTNTSGEEVEEVKSVCANLPIYITQKYQREHDQRPANTVTTRLKIKRKFDHYSSEVNRARYMPQNSKILASVSGTGTAYIYAQAESKKINKAPVLSLEYHKENAYGLDWSGFQQGCLLTGSDDKTVCLWDINGKPFSIDTQSENQTVSPLSVISSHTDIVNDVKWHKFDANLFGSVSDDKSLHIHDTRSPGKPSMKAENVSEQSVNAVSFSPFSRNLLAVGSSDATVGLLDLRNLDRKLHSMMGHSESVTTIEWSPHQDGFLASGSEDRRVIIWDVSRIGEEQNQDDADDGAPELFMMHAGHTSLVTDLSWHPNENMKWLLSSVSDNNMVQLWKISRNLTDPVDGWDSQDIDEELE